MLSRYKSKQNLIKLSTAVFMTHHVHKVLTTLKTILPSLGGHVTGNVSFMSKEDLFTLRILSEDGNNFGRRIHSDRCYGQL